ncbi:MAG: YbjN domain-containing protein [Hydrogenimonas sp.]|nr:YbjN domain-containing protein [Hydrogenimonas sp.]
MMNGFRFKRTAVAALLTMTMLSAPAAAGVIKATDTDSILNVAKGYGSATLKKDSSGDPLIVGRIDGTKYGILFYGCENGKNCDDIQFAASWSGVKVTLQDINRWNKSKRYGKAYLDDDGDPRLEMPVNLDYGVTDENFDDTFDWWTKVLKEFKESVLKI